MAKRLLILNGLLVNEGRCFHADILVEGARIVRIESKLSPPADKVIDAAGLYVLPGVIDDQVHFREPGYPHTATIASESRAAVAGGVTSYMEMPNTAPPATTRVLLEEKYARAARSSYANYSFYMGTTHENAEEAVRIDPRKVCGIKIFMGSSTGNMLVDDPQKLDSLFQHAPTLIAVHCEKEKNIQENLAAMRARYGRDIPMQEHPRIRDAKACYLSSKQAIALAKKHGTRLNVLHISTEEEVALFSDLPTTQKNITAEVCVHHLWFCQEDYPIHGGYLKTNPAIKSQKDRTALWEGLLGNRLDIVASDHAPHPAAEKEQPYLQCPAGMPMVAHTLLAMLEKTREKAPFGAKGALTLPLVVEKMCHAPAKVYGVKDRGFLREGYYADIAIVDPRSTHRVDPKNIHYKVGWSVFSGMTFHHTIAHTLVSGHLAYSRGSFSRGRGAQRLELLPP